MTDSKSNLLLDVRGICKSFPGVRALNGVNLQVRSGEIHAVLGENGAGKSTLMHILAGVFPPDEGDIYLDGTRVAFFAGSGRTELALTIFGARPMISGRISIQGHPVVIRSPQDAIQAGIGYLPEGATLLRAKTWTYF